jgi:hypothetical protein
MLRSLKVIFLNGKLEERIKNTLAHCRGGADSYREGAGGARLAEARGQNRFAPSAEGTPSNAH